MRARRHAIAAVLLALGLAAGCAERESSLTPPPERVEEREGDGTLSQALLVALAQAKNFHHLADVHLSDGNPEGAIEAVTRILSLPFPPGAPETEDTLLDARARLAKLELAAGRIDRALAVVDEGIRGARRESFFLANLYTVLGEVHEARAAALADDPQAARQARRDAIVAYERSIAINEKVQAELLEEVRP